MAAQIKCYNCGADVIIGDNPNIGICSACFAEVPLPKDLVSLGQAYSHANVLLSSSRFQEAREAFREILVRAPLEAAACWGYAVSEYGIEFVQDPATAQLLPTLHRLSNARFSEYLYVKKAIEYAPDYYSRQFYIEQSALIDSIQSQSLQISRKEDPYDVFICYKKTEVGEKRTSDSRIAADLYKELVRRGYKTFFAEETLHVGEEYEPRIFAALNSAKVLLAIGSREEYYEAVWVKNEWSRYIDLIRTEQAQGDKSRLLIPVFYNIPHNQIPADLQKMTQYVDMSQSDNPKQVLFQLIAAHFSGKNRDEVADLRRQVRGKSTGNVRLEHSAANFITRGTIELVNGSFETAEDMFLQSLDTAVSSEAYLGLMMCQLKLCGKEALHSYAGDIRGLSYYQQALSVASEAEAAELETIAKTCLENAAWKEKCARAQEECNTATRGVLSTLQKFTLPAPVQHSCAETESFISNAINSGKRFLTERTFPRELRSFLYWGNLIPAILMVLSELAAKVGYDPTIDWISAPGLLLMLVFYVKAGLFLLGCLPLLGSEGFMTIVRGAIGFGGCMFLIQELTSYDDRVQFLLVSAAASALFFLCYDLWRMPKKKAYKAYLKQISTHIQRNQQCLAALEKETLDALMAVAAPYQQYYQPDEWKSNVQRWQNVVHTACQNRLAQQLEALNNIKR